MTSALRAALFDAFLWRLMFGGSRGVSVTPVYAFLARAAPRDNPQRYGWAAARSDTLLSDDARSVDEEWKSLSRGASLERLWGISERTSVRLVFLFLGGFLLGCHEVFPPFERFVLPRFSTGRLDARATQLVV